MSSPTSRRVSSSRALAFGAERIQHSETNERLRLLQARSGLEHRRIREVAPILDTPDERVRGLQLECTRRFLQRLCRASREARGVVVPLEPRRHRKPLPRPQPRVARNALPAQHASGAAAATVITIANPAEP